jgi:hypothetical protein
LVIALRRLRSAFLIAVVFAETLADVKFAVTEESSWQ